MIRDLHCTNFQATIGFSMFALGFGVTPLFTAPFSEEFGRRPLYLVSAVGFLAMHILVAVYGYTPTPRGSMLTDHISDLKISTQLLLRGF